MFEIRMRIFNFTKLKIEESQTINDCIYEFINNNFEDLPNKKKDIENNIPKQNIYFNCQIQNEKSINLISIEFYYFSILIKLPQKYSQNDFLFKKNVLIKNKYELIDNSELDKKNKLFELNEFFYKKSDLKIENEFQIKNAFQFKNKYLLIKIRNFFQDIIEFIIKSIFEEIEKDKRIISGNVLIEFCKRFLFFIHDYNNLFKTKCSFCQKIVKYSFNEKCFFFFYIKKYQERNLNSFRYNNVDNTKIFYHEQCYRRINLPNL